MHDDDHGSTHVAQARQLGPLFFRTDDRDWHDGHATTQRELGVTYAPLLLLQGAGVLVP